ncbi:MAG: FAD-dependent monooxygenase [Polyangiaceae bacterium]|nr:FAD-dependent monooxygenase [Polyangiaceae bacterium]
MSAESSKSPQILIVGAGPVGLTLACELFRHGVPCRIIDMEEGPSIWSKAAAVQTRTLEVFDDMGIAAEAVARGRPIYGVSIFSGEKRVGRLLMELHDTPYPYMLGMSQRDTEVLLGEHLVRLGGRIERGVKLENFTQDEGGVTAELVGPGEKIERVRAAWLIGCDGAHSAVRKTLGLSFEGSTFEQSILQADIKMTVPVPHDEHEAVLFLSPSGAAGFLPVFGEGRCRLILMAPPEDRSEPTLENIQSLVAERCPPGTEVSDPAWMIGFRFHSRIAPAYRVDRVFIAGDAAHIHSPAGAQGMNLGIQDAYNLAWKLALVVRGAGRPELLDSYHPERHPVAATIVKTTDLSTRGMIRMISLRAPVAQELRNQAIGFLMSTQIVQERAFRAVSGVKVDYRGSPIVGEHRTSLWRTSLRKTTSTEAPAVADWLDFGDGPGPGARVGDIDLAWPLDGRQTVFDLLRGTRHVLFLFDGAAPTEEGYANFSKIAGRIQDRYGEHIVTYVVTPSAEKPAALAWDGPVVLDEGSVLHRHFGAGSECLYLIRPDGYVGFRSLPADEAKLFEHLEAIFA